MRIRHLYPMGVEVSELRLADVDAAVAARLRSFIYAAGNSLEPGAAYQAFRGRAPTVEPMLRKKGLLAPATAAAGAG